MKKLPKQRVRESEHHKISTKVGERWLCIFQLYCATLSNKEQFVHG